VSGDRLADTGMFDRGYLMELVDRHQSGRSDFSAALWTILMFDAFLRNVMEETTERTQTVDKAA
jgi:asparagine synthase (glutamine-hydrolysing)